MGKLKEMILNHRKAFIVAGSSAVIIAAVGCGIAVGYTVGGKAGMSASSRAQQDRSNSQYGSQPGVNADTTEADIISARDAQNIALRDAGLTEGSVTFVKSETENDDGTLKYEIEFFSGNSKYEYEINAKTSEILYREFEMEYEGIEEEANLSDEPGTSLPANASLSIDEAKAAALADADLAEAVFTKAKLDYEDNLDIYEIEFYFGTAEYEYEIAVYSGIILKKEVKFGNSKNVINGNDIGIEAAKEAAANDAGLNISDISFSKAKKDTEDGISVYEIDFTAADIRYEYEISAYTGEILKKEETYINDLSTINSQAYEIYELESAKSIALADAGVQASNASFTKSKLSRDSGREVYDIEFYTADCEYNYEIDAVSGNIIKKKSKTIKTNAESANVSKYIGIEEAKLVALNHCGLSAQDVVFTQAKQDYNDGVDCYELEFCTAEQEYEYEINCVTGEILHSECHVHDDDDD